MKEKYFNCPVSLLKDFVVDTNNVLDNIMDYNGYSYLIKYFKSNGITREIKEEDLKMAGDFFYIQFGNYEKSLSNGEWIYKKHEKEPNIIQINNHLLFDYYKNDKTEWQKILLLAYLSLKSIIGNNVIAKTNNLMMLSRMNGDFKRLKSDDKLKSIIKKYSSKYYCNKMREQLALSFGLNYIGIRQRGFTFSFSLSIDKLKDEILENGEQAKRKRLREEQKRINEEMKEKLKEHKTCKVVATKEEKPVKKEENTSFEEQPAPKPAPKKEDIYSLYKKAFIELYKELTSKDYNFTKADLQGLKLIMLLNDTTKEDDIKKFKEICKSYFKDTETYSIDFIYEKTKEKEDKEREKQH
jgi:hypothetical protein